MSNNVFTLSYLREILETAKQAGYRFMTLGDYVASGCPKSKVFIFRLDLDLKPQALKPIVSLLASMRIPATVFVRVAGPYNIFWYPVYACIKQAYDAGCEIGLHTTPVEWAKINERDVSATLSGELSALRSLFPVTGIAPHRDINYVHNSLPWIDDNWESLMETHQIKYHAYEKKILSDLLYVNEGLSPHLCWRNLAPHDAIATGKPICMLLHPHWWFESNPFETE